ncbi:MAG: hypothetical protein ACUVSF_00590 [Anaerolineae bacterium]
MDARWQIVAYLVASVLFRLAAERIGLFVRANASRHPIWMHFGSPFLRFSYYIGLPYIALLLGALPARYLGLIGLEQLQSAAERSAANGVMEQLRIAVALLLRAWLPHLGQWAGLVILMAGLLTVTWTLYRYARCSAEREPPPSGMLNGAGSVTAFAMVVYNAVHWSFYRAGIWWLSDDLYLGVVGGVALVLVEWILCVWSAEWPSQLLSFERHLVDASLLITTAAIFYYVPNLWLLILAHWLLARLCRRLYVATPRFGALRQLMLNKGKKKF